jgi:hypothetical protein
MSERTAQPILGIRSSQSGRLMKATLVMFTICAETGRHESERGALPFAGQEK